MSDIGQKYSQSSVKKHKKKIMQTLMGKAIKSVPSSSGHGSHGGQKTPKAGHSSNQHGPPPTFANTAHDSHKTAKKIDKKVDKFDKKVDKWDKKVDRFFDKLFK